MSTKGIELHRDVINGTTIEFYDCAGQVDYYGMHQTFLTRRALYLLVWDVHKCFGKAGETLDEVRSKECTIGTTLDCTERAKASEVLHRSRFLPRVVKGV